MTENDNHFIHYCLGRGEGGSQAALGAIFQHQIAAVGVGDVAGDAKAQPGPGGSVAEAIVGLEDAFELIVRQTGALVHDEEDQHLLVIHDDDAHLLAVL